MVNRDRLRDLLLIMDGCSAAFYKSLPYPTERDPLRFGTQSAEPLVFRVDFFERADIWFEYRRQLAHSSITKMAEIPMPIISRNLQNGRMQTYFLELHDREVLLLEAVARWLGEEALLRAERGEVAA